MEKVYTTRDRHAQDVAYSAEICLAGQIAFATKVTGLASPANDTLFPTP